MVILSDKMGKGALVPVTGTRALVLQLAYRYRRHWHWQCLEYPTLERVCWCSRQFLSDGVNIWWSESYLLQLLSFAAIVAFILRKNKKVQGDGEQNRSATTRSLFASAVMAAKTNPS